MFSSKLSKPIPYKEFLKLNAKYDGNSKCFVYDCTKPALYEGGDARFYCGMCEEHAGMLSKYRFTISNILVDRNEKLSGEELYKKANEKYEHLVKLVNKQVEEQYGREFGKA